MNRLRRKMKKVKPFAKFLFILIAILYLISFIFFAKNVLSLNKIETLIRYLVLALLIIYYIFYILFSLTKLIQKKYVSFYLNSILGIILIAIFCGGSYVIDFVYDSLSGFTEKEKLTYTSYLITMDDNNITSSSTLGMIENEEDIEGHILAKQIMEEKNLDNEVEYYDDTTQMLYDLYEGKVDGIFVSSNYVTLYSSEADFHSIATDTKVVYRTSGEFANKDLELSSDKELTEPVSILIMGVDSEFDGLDANVAFNGDTLILATFNPDTLNATLLSIPRDTYVPIACRNNAQAKINSSAAYGTSCVIETVENLTSIDIDYYVKINFKGVVDLVDALGGIEVDVEEPYKQFNHSFDCKGMVCEQNSDRQWGDKTVYIAPGLQKLDGEQALAYSRCRDLYIESDLARNRHQQDVILAVAKKASQIRKYSEFKEVFDAISKNISTNMSTDQMLSSYNILKDMLGKVLADEEFINIQKSYLETYNLSVYLPSLGMHTSALGYYEASLQDITNAMEVNLGLKEPDVVKTFNYSINETYEEYVVGKGLRTSPSNSLIGNMVGLTREEAESYCSKAGMSCKFTYVDEESSHYNPSFGEDIIGSQNPEGDTLATGVSYITFYINGASSED